MKLLVIITGSSKYNIPYSNPEEAEAAFKVAQAAWEAEVASSRTQPPITLVSDTGIIMLSLCRTESITLLDVEKNSQLMHEIKLIDQITEASFQEKTL